MKKNFISASYFIYLYRCKAALDRFQTRLRSENFVPPRLTVSKLGHFDDKVLFAALDDNEGLEDLKSKYIHQSLYIGVMRKSKGRGVVRGIYRFGTRPINNFEIFRGRRVCLTPF